MCYEVISQAFEENSKKQKTEQEPENVKTKNYYKTAETKGSKFSYEKNQLRIEESQKEMANSTIEFLNLIFGKSDDSELFWNQIVSKQGGKKRKKFNFQIIYFPIFFFIKN